MAVPVNTAIVGVVGEPVKLVALEPEEPTPAAEGHAAPLVAGLLFPGQPTGVLAAADTLLAHGTGIVHGQSVMVSVVADAAL